MKCLKFTPSPIIRMQSNGGGKWLNTKQRSKIGQATYWSTNWTTPCCYHKGQIVNSTMFNKGRLTLILFFQLNLSYINKPFRKMPKNSNFLIRLETGCTDCLLQVYTKENKRKVTWYGQQNLSLVNTIEQRPPGKTLYCLTAYVVVLFSQ